MNETSPNWVLNLDHIPPSVITDEPHPIPRLERRPLEQSAQMGGAAHEMSRGVHTVHRTRPVRQS